MSLSIESTRALEIFFCKVVFLSGPDSPETLVLPQDIENDLTANTGRGVALLKDSAMCLSRVLKRGREGLPSLLEIKDC